MAKTTGATKLSELMTIRDILMGEIIEEYNGRFEELEKKLVDQQNDLEKKQETINNRIDELQKTLDASHVSLSQALNDNSVQDKALIGELLVKIGQELNSIKQ